MTEIFSVPRNTIFNIIKKYRETGSVENRIENRHRPRKTSPRQDHLIILEAKRDPFTSTKIIKDYLEATDPNLKISRMTVSNRLKEADLSAKRPRKVPYKSKKHRKARVKLGKKYQNCDKKFLDG